MEELSGGKILEYVSVQVDLVSTQQGIIFDMFQEWGVGGVDVGILLCALGIWTGRVLVSLPMSARTMPTSLSSLRDDREQNYEEGVLGQHSLKYTARFLIRK